VVRGGGVGVAVIGVSHGVLGGGLRCKVG
jgi:hypothetical protein